MHANENLKAFGDKILVKRDVENDRTKGGIYLAETAKRKVNCGTVVSVGEGRILENGEHHKLSVKVGERICFGLYAGHDITYDNGDKFVMMEESEVFGVIEE